MYSVHETWFYWIENSIPPQHLNFALVTFVVFLLMLMILNIVMVLQIRSKTENLAREIAERREAEKRSRILSSIVEQTMEGIALVDLSGNLLLMNKAFADAHGYDRNELIGKHLSIFHTPEQMPTVNAVNLQIRESGVFTGEIWHVRRDGTVFPALMHNTLLRDEAGVVIGIIGTLCDITEIKKNEKILQQNQQFLQIVFDAILDGISILDTDLNIVRVNKGMEKMFPNIPLVGAKCYVAYHGRNTPCLECPSSRTLATGKEALEIVPYVRDGKRLGWIELATFPIFDVQGNVTGVVEYVKNITDSKTTEKYLRRVTDINNILVQGLPAFFVAIAVTGETIMMNDAMLQALGYTAEEVIGVNYFDTFVSQGERPGVDDVFFKLLQKHPNTFHVNHIVCKDGRQLLVEWQGRTILKEDGNIDFVLGLGIDVTVRKHLEEQLIQSQKMEAIGRLAGGIAHDFNNLLTIMIGSNQLLMDELKADDPCRIETDEIKKATDRAAALTRQLLAFSRRQVLKQKVININSLVIDMEKMLRRLIGEDIQLVTILSSQLNKIKGDTGQIEQVIMNLVINSRDAMPGGGKIVVKTEDVTFTQAQCQVMSEVRPGNFVSLAVTDTGSGIDSSVLQHIFEPFFTTKKVNEGCGLGLSVVYGIVKQHEGWIDVKSEAGIGTIFKVYLPTWTEKPGEEIVEENSLECIRGNGENILLVEDDETLRLFAKRLLQKHNYLVWEATTAQEALDIFEREKGNFQLLFSDTILPGESGLKLAERLLAIKPDLRILITSGYTNQKIELQDIQKGRFSFIQKPYKISELLQSIKASLAHTKR